MDLPISCQDIYCIYKHPLSILIHLKYQDKDGCSKNGSKNFLSDIRCLFKISDSRGVPLVIDPLLPSRLYPKEEEILNFKQLSCSVGSSVPIVQEEREAMRQLFYVNELHPRSEYKSKLLHDWWFERKIIEFPTLLSACGHMIGKLRFIPKMKFLIKFNAKNVLINLSALEQLPHFRILSCDIEKLPQDNSYFEDNFGRVLGSKLVHLSIVAYEDPTISQLENCMYQFTKLKLLNLRIVRSNFDSSILNIFN